MKLGMGQKRLVRKLFSDASSYESDMTDAKLPEDLPVDGPHIVVDPRRIGFDYLSYSFIESGEELPDISEEGKKIADDFQDTKLNNGLLLGITLGGFDMAHRRVEKQQHSHAEFAVESINSSSMNYIEGIETYPIWAIARWHGQNIPEQRMFNDVDFEYVSPLEAEILYELMQYPNDKPEDIAARIEHRVENSMKSKIKNPQNLPSPLEPEVSNKIDILWDNNVILGESIKVNVSESGHKHVLIGMDVGELSDEELVEEKEALDEELRRDPLPNEVIMKKMKEEFDNTWEMPYIVSGVGQDWADILVEFHIEDVQDMEDCAARLRQIPGINSTRTHLFTHEVGNKPLIVDDPSYFETNE